MVEAHETVVDFVFETFEFVFEAIDLMLKLSKPVFEALLAFV